MIILITNDAESDGFGCPYCDKAKDALERAGVEFTVQRVAAEYRPAMYDAWGLTGSARTIPQLIVDGRRIGGYAETVKWLEEIVG